MSQESVENFLGRLVTDSDFRKKCMKSLEKTCRANGFVFTNAEFEAINNTDIYQFSLFQPSTDDRIRRA